MGEPETEPARLSFWRRPAAGEPHERLGRAAEARRIARELVDEFAEHDLLTFSSAIAFQVLFALVPLALALLALLGFLGLEDVWREDLAPEVRERVAAEDAFSLLDRTVEQVIGTGRGVWLTFGAGFALWALSGAIRASSGPLNTIYEKEEDRPWWRRMLVSVALALSIGPCLLVAVIAFSVGDEVVRAVDVGAANEIVALLARWGVGSVLLLFATWLTLRFTPAGMHNVPWVTAGTLLVLIGWVVVSLGYGWYVRSVAPYETVFGALASVIVLMTYLHLLAIAFLGGAASPRRSFAGSGSASRATTRCSSSRAGSATGRARSSSPPGARSSAGSTAGSSPSSAGG
jgi:membrane protein